jgi:dihydrofolate reductase
VALVAAVARGGVIGRDSGIPWRLPEDMQRFRALTMGHPVVMGRRTWESLPDRFRPLPGRENVVLTRDPDWSARGALRAASIEDALRLLEGEEMVFVIGGGEIYAAAFPFVDELLLTEIDAEIDGDTYFPAWNRDVFEEVTRERHVTDEGVAFSFVTYRRSAADRQLAALAEVVAQFDGARIDYWMLGGWAVDFHAGRITRRHDDVDLAVWRADLPRIVALFECDGWSHAPYPDEDGGTGYERAGVRLELTYLVRKDDGTVVLPMHDREVTWPEGTFGDEQRELGGVRAKVISLAVLTRGKSAPRDGVEDAAKDRADFAILSDL